MAKKKISEESDFKLQLEEEKLQLEILELKRPWFKKPTFFVPMTGAISSLIILWITGFFNTSAKELKIERSILQTETTALQKAKKKLEIDSTNLAHGNDTLNLTKRELTFQNRKLADERLKLENEKSEVQKKSLIISKNLKSLQLATKPKIDIGFHESMSDQDIGIYISNMGTGTAYIRQINAYYKGRKFDGDLIYKNPFWIEVAQAMRIDEPWLRWESILTSKDLEKATPIAAGKGYYPIKISNSLVTEMNRAIFVSVIKDLEIEFIYYSVDKKIYTVRRGFK